MNESKAEHSSDNCANDEQIIGIIVVIIRPALRLMHYITAAVAIHAVDFIDCSATLVLAAVTVVSSALSVAVYFHSTEQLYKKLSYRKQIARQLRIQYVEGIYIL